MKILKKPDNILFDTEKPNVMEFKPISTIHEMLLHQQNSLSDWDFLSKHFKAINGVGHPIFENFGRSYYYLLPDNDFTAFEKYFEEHPITTQNQTISQP